MVLVYPGTASADDTFVKLPNPADLPPNNGKSVAFSYDSTYMAVSHDDSPYITIYKRSGDTFTKLDDPVELPTSTGMGVAFSPDSNYLAVALGGSPYITIYKRSNDNFTRLAGPAILPPHQGNGVAFSHDSTYLVVAHDGYPQITIYKRSGDTFTKLPDPDDLPPHNGRCVAFSHDSTYLAVGYGSYSPYFSIYKRSGDTFTKLPNPADLPPNAALGVAFSHDSTYMAVADNDYPYVLIYKRSGDTFTKLADPATLPSDISVGVAFSHDSTYLAIGHSFGPDVTIYQRGEDIFTKIANPATLPTGRGQGIAFSHDSIYMAVAHQGSPNISIYKKTASPTFVSATTSAAGTIITITFDNNMADPSGKHAEFSYKIGAGIAQNFSEAAISADNTKIDLTCSGTAIASGDTVTISYTRGTVLAEDGGALESFTDQPVTNAVCAAPTVTNASGASSIMATTAILNGNLISDGGAETTVTIYWGTTNGERGTWDNVYNLGIRTPGPFSLGVTGLTPGMPYYYRCSANNMVGTAWAEPSLPFTTQANLGLWRNYWEGPGKDWWRFSSGRP